MKHIIELKCRFEGTVLGTVEVETDKMKQKYGKIPMPEEMGFIDLRCDSCTIMYGKYSEMERLFTTAGGTMKQFEKHMKNNNYKNTKIDDAIKNIKEGKDPDAPRPNIV